MYDETEIKSVQEKLDLLEGKFQSLRFVAENIIETVAAKRFLHLEEEEALARCVGDVIDLQKDFLQGLEAIKDVPYQDNLAALRTELKVYGDRAVALGKYIPFREMFLRLVAEDMDCRVALTKAQNNLRAIDIKTAPVEDCIAKLKDVKDFLDVLQKEKPLNPPRLALSCFQKLAGKFDDVLISAAVMGDPAIYIPEQEMRAGAELGAKEELCEGVHAVQEEWKEVPTVLAAEAKADAEEKPEISPIAEEKEEKILPPVTESIPVTESTIEISKAELYEKLKESEATMVNVVKETEQKLAVKPEQSVEVEGKEVVAAQTESAEKTAEPVAIPAIAIVSEEHQEEKPEQKVTEVPESDATFRRLHKKIFATHSHVVIEEHLEAKKLGVKKFKRYISTTHPNEKKNALKLVQQSIFIAERLVQLSKSTKDVVDIVLHDFVRRGYLKRYSFRGLPDLFSATKRCSQMLENKDVAALLGLTQKKSIEEEEELISPILALRAILCEKAQMKHYKEEKKVLSMWQAHFENGAGYLTADDGEAAWCEIILLELPSEDMRERIEALRAELPAYTKYGIMGYDEENIEESKKMLRDIFCVETAESYALCAS